MALDLPLSVQAADRDTWRHHAATIHERRIAADADEAAPRAHADQRPEFGFAEQPRHGIATRAGVLIDDHDLRAEDRQRRIEIRCTVASDDNRARLATENVDHVVGNLAAVVVALVED